MSSHPDIELDAPVQNALSSRNSSAGFEEDPPRLKDSAYNSADALLLNIDGYEGPLDVLLDMARSQKVDMTQISVLQLARQYLEFMERAKQLNLDLAAEYLVMAAWLTYLKSRLLLPRENEEEQHSAEDMAEALQFQLRRLEAIRRAADDLGAQPQLGKDVFSRVNAEGLSTTTHTKWDVSLYDMLSAYSDIQKRQNRTSVELPKFRLLSAENAMSMLEKMLGRLPRTGAKSVWTTLRSFLPQIKDKLFARSSLASTLTAGLEMVKQGRLEIRQDGLFKPIYMRELAQSAVNDDSQAQDEALEHNNEGTL